MAEKNSKGLQGNAETDDLEGARKTNSHDHSVIDQNFKSSKLPADTDVSPLSGPGLRSDSIKKSLLLDAHLKIERVNELYAVLVDSFDQHEKFEFDASEVESIDTAALQLLIVLKRTAVEHGKQMTIDFPSDAFIEAARLLGIAEMLGVEQVEAGLF